MVLAMILCTAINVAAVLLLVLVFSRIGRLIDRIPARTASALSRTDAEPPRDTKRAVEILTRLATSKLESIVASVASHEQQLARSVRSELEAARERAALLDRQLLPTATATHKVSELLRDAQALLDHAADLQIASTKLHRSLQPAAGGTPPPAPVTSIAAPVAGGAADEDAVERPTIEMRAQPEDPPARTAAADEVDGDGVTVVARREVIVRAAARSAIQRPSRHTGEAP